MSRFHLLNKIPLLIAIFAGVLTVLPVEARFLRKDVWNEKIPDTLPKEEPRVKQYPDKTAYNIRTAEDRFRMNSVIITWDVNPGSDHTFFVARSGEQIDSIEKVNKSSPVEVVYPGMKNRVVDLNLRPGDYYYAVVSEKALISGSVEFYPEVNYTVEPVVFEKIPHDSYYGLILFEVEENNVTLRWRPDKSRVPVDGFAIYRKDIPIENYEILMEADHLVTLAGDLRLYEDSGLSPGEYYYAVITKYADGSVDLGLVGGINFTSSPAVIVFSGEEHIAEIRKLEEPELPYMGAELEKPEMIKPELPPITEFFIETEETVEPAAPEPPPVPAAPPPRPVVNVDHIISNTFFQERYRTAIDALGRSVPHLRDRRAVARAMLFIGRSYIELNEYDRALEYFVREDVRYYFPDESRFWRDFALQRIR